MKRLRIQVLIITITAGHIPGTSHCDLPRTVENRRDLNRKSNHMHGAFAMVSETGAQDPAYRPTHPSTWLCQAVEYKAQVSPGTVHALSRSIVEPVASAAWSRVDYVAFQVRAADETSDVKKGSATAGI
jgi:hypothetical protein